MLINAKLQIGKRGQKQSCLDEKEASVGIELQRHPRRRRKKIFDFLMGIYFC